MHRIQAVVLLIATIAWVFDIIYRVRGGVGSTWKERRGLLIALGSWFVFGVTLAPMFTHSHKVGALMVRLLIFIFGAWEAYRWKVRSNARIGAKPGPVLVTS